MGLLPLAVGEAARNGTTSPGPDQRDWPRGFQTDGVGASLFLPMGSL